MAEHVYHILAAAVEVGFDPDLFQLPDNWLHLRARLLLEKKTFPNVPPTPGPFDPPSPRHARSEVDACRPSPSAEPAPRISISILSLGAALLTGFPEYRALERQSDWDTVHRVARSASRGSDPEEHGVKQALDILNLEGVPQPNLVLSCLGERVPAPDSGHTGLSHSAQAGKAIAHALA